MQLRVALILLALASAPLLSACSSGGGATDQAFYYPPPVNYNPSAGLTPDLTDSRLLSVSAPPFRP